MDFSVTNHGSVWTIEAVSPAAIEFAEENFAVPSWSGEPTRFTTDWRPARDLCELLVREGWRVR
jgi:hypothetical protein